MQQVARYVSLSLATFSGTDEIPMDVIGYISGMVADIIGSGDWSNMNLTYLNLINNENESIAGFNMARSDLSGACLRGGGRGSSRRRNLSRVNLSGANCRGANFFCVDLVGANLTNTDFREAVLQDSDLHRADIRGSTFIGAKLSQYKDTARTTLSLHANV